MPRYSDINRRINDQSMTLIKLFLWAFQNSIKVNLYKAAMVFWAFNPILYGLFLYVKIRVGGLFDPPWLKLEKWLKLGKRHFLAKIDYCCPLFMHLELNYYHFWLKKGQKNCRRVGLNRGIEGSPLWIVCGKNCRRKIFWIFQKDIPKMAYPGPFEYWKEQSHEKSAHLVHPPRISQL